MTERSPRRTGRQVGVALLILSVLSFVETLRINDGWAGARLLPLIVSLAFLGLGLAHLSAKGAPAPGSGDGISDPRPERGAVLLVLASLVGYVALLSTAGFALATFGLLLILVHRLGGYGWKHSIGLAVGLALATHVVFVVWLGMPLPAGPLSSHGSLRAAALTPMNLAFALIGAILGTLVGVLPGIGPTSGIAILPLTAVLPPTPARRVRAPSSSIEDKRSVWWRKRLVRYDLVAYRSMRLTEARGNPPPAAGSIGINTRGLATDLTGATPAGNPGKPVGAVVAAAKVLRTLHGSERPLNASEVARAAGLHRGTAYNILRTLHTEGFVGYDEATRSYSVSLHILEIAHGVLRRSGLMDLARPLMHAVSDAHGVSVYLSKVLGPSALLLLDWVGAALRTDLYVTVGRQYPGPAGASGVIMAAFGTASEARLEGLFADVAWYQKPSFADFMARVDEARQSGFAVDRDTMFQGITQVSVPVLSPSWELLLIVTAAGHSHDLDGDAVRRLSRAMQSAAARLSESVRLLRLG